MSAGRLATHLKRHVLRRSLPHGIVSWRYLSPRPPEKIRLHRGLWLRAKHPCIPLPLYFALEIFLWLRWVSFACWRSCWHVMAHRGKAVTEQDKIGRVAQLGHLLRLGLCHCIPPGEAYSFGLYRRESRQDFWNYVFLHEVIAFHRWRGAKIGETPESLAMLQDKHRLTEFLGSRNIPMAPILAMVPRGGSFDPMPFLQTYGRVFCKPRRGSASRDAFVIESREKTFAVFAVKSGMKAHLCSPDRLNKAILRDDFLVQPFLENHPAFATLCPAGDVATLRVITEIHPMSEIACYCATLEIPNTSDGVLTGHVILPVEPLSGRITRFTRSLPPSVQTRHDAVFDQIGNRTVPFWDTIMKSAISSHKYFADVRAIAWDYVMTPYGPIMLEGNTGWRTTTPQMLHGGLLTYETLSE